MIWSCRRPAVTVAMAAAMSGLLAASAPVASAATGGPEHGLVGTTCAASRVAADRSATAVVAVLSARWDLMFPARGTADANYRSQLVAAIRSCVAGGLRVVLDAGVQFVPAWARSLRGAAMVDQYGATPVTNQLDLVFSADVRTAVTEYLNALVAAIPAYTVEAVRVGTAVSGELGLPGGYDGGRGYADSWWAFGAAPQNGVGLASGQTRSPLPGWVPGQARWNNRAVTATDALTWFRWYDRSLEQAEVFLAKTVATAGWRGRIHLPVAGRGVTPAEVNAATANLLAGAAMTDDAFARGLDYVDQMPLIAQAVPGAVVSLTSVDDATSVTARAANPPQDICLTSDASTSISTSTPVGSWSNLRFARAQVARAGLAAVGENPGPPAPQTGGVPGSDPETEQLRRSPGYARSCGLAALYFAFEDDLYTGRSGITAADYAAAW